MLNKIYICIFIFCVFSQAKANLTCSRGTLTILENGAETPEKSYYCYNTNRNTLVSQSCRTPESTHCLAQDTVKLARKNKLKIDDSEFGKPGFHLCKEMGAHPQLLRFSVGKENYKLDRCLFKDGSYMDTGELIKRVFQDQPEP